ncbi:MAG: TetR/AcrR family transcriptional regulator [bacterium]|nr:TetR/AcrR family transcriptional regulator [bacterium]
MTAARDQIVETTCTLLEVQGYHATGLNQILKESGSPKGSLYYYFPGGKEELTTEALNRVGGIVLERIQANLAAVDDAADAVRGFIHHIAVNVEASGYTAGGPITTVAMETSATNERLRAACARIYESWQALFRDKLTAHGFTPERAEPLSALIIAALEGGIILCRTRRSPQPLHDIAEEVGRLIALG